MSRYGYLEEAMRVGNATTQFTKLTVGEVIDTNDPQQMGRLRVVCPALGDTDFTPIKDLPWATYVSPFGGIVDSGTRGRGEYETVGPVAYGMWNIPKVGSTVLIACIDGDTRFRIWMGCLHGQFMNHTMPHGRYTYKNGQLPSGPISSTEDPIYPLHDQLTIAFSSSDASLVPGSVGEARRSFEFQTRGADYSIAGITDEIVNSIDSEISQLSDDRDVEVTDADGTSRPITQGYAESRIDPTLVFAATNNKNYDSSYYAWTSPGFHSISMDDRPENCRIRLRTTHGHQILMDDTNERMYISTPQGSSWVELDEKGNIDIYSDRNVSVHAKKDINFTADDTFRVTAANGIHMVSEGDVRIHAKGGDGINIKSDVDANIESSASLNVKTDTASIQTTGDFNVKSGSILYLTAQNETHIKASGKGYLTASAVDVLATGGDIVMVGGPNIHMNGPPASSAGSAGNAGTSKESFWTSRVPEHEPWARTMTDPLKTDQDSNNTHTDAAEYSYNDINVGRVERGEDLERNPKWHR